MLHSRVGNSSETSGTQLSLGSLGRSTLSGFSLLSLCVCGPVIYRISQSSPAAPPYPRLLPFVTPRTPEGVGNCGTPRRCCLSRMHDGLLSRIAAGRVRRR